MITSKMKNFMKIKILLAAMLAAGVFLTGCDKEDDGIQVDQHIENAFLAQYPEATGVKWEMKSGYYVADFRLNNAEAEAWYNAQAVWQMTETDVSYADLPQQVRSAFEAGEYAEWKIDDIDKLESLGMETVYIIEVEQGEVEYDLYYSPDGVFIKAVSDEDGNDYLPTNILSTIKEYITANYPQARIADIEEENNRIEVDIIDGSTPREVVFSQSGEWIYTKTEVGKSSVPAVVLNALEASEYSSWQIDDIDHYLMPAGEYYLFELESGNREVELKIDIVGNIL